MKSRSCRVTGVSPPPRGARLCTYLRRVHTVPDAGTAARGDRKKSGHFLALPSSSLLNRD